MKSVTFNIEVLRQLLQYDPSTGELTWLKRSEHFFSKAKHPKQKAAIWNARYAGKPALNAVSNNGYARGKLFDRDVRAHRVAWAMFYGEWPIGVIDHINGNKMDNRIKNLRDVSPGDNSRNAKRYGTNTSGVSGVVWNKKAKKWLARIKGERQQIHLGSFEEKEHAIIARKAAEKALGFHENHGRSA